MAQEKVLIVEDEENERTGLAELVSSWGYRAETAADGVEALEKATAWMPAVIASSLPKFRLKLSTRTAESRLAMSRSLPTEVSVLPSLT